MSAPFSGQLSEAEYARFQRAAIPGFLRALPWILSAALVVLLLQNKGDLVDTPGDLIRVSAGIVFIVLLFVAPWWGIRKAWRGSPALRAPFSGVVDDSGILWNSEFVKARFPWSALIGYRLRGDLLYVYTASNSALILLPRVFESSQGWTVASELVKAQLQKK